MSRPLRAPAAVPLLLCVPSKREPDMNLLHKINESLLAVASWGTIFFMGVIAIVIPYEVFGRYVIKSMSVWSGEVSTFSLAWATMLGGAVGLKKGYQVSMTAMLELAPPSVVRLLKGVGYLCMLTFLATMTWYGGVQTIINFEQTSPAMGIKMGFPYACIPTGFFIMFMLTVEEVLAFLGASVPKGSAA
jgi:TRAP-type C4-dicarboxylate transport system permease small subunit